MNDQFDEPQVPNTPEFEQPVDPFANLSGNKVDVSPVETSLAKVRGELSKVLIGQVDLVDQLFAALLVNGHVLLEGVPGVAKTLTAKLLAKALQVDFSRIQFTPDLMPSDVVGTTVFNLQKSEFIFNEGPIFSNIILIDEINRAPAKTQSALFEVMEEYQVTVDGTTYLLEQPFLVLATQNPIEQEGTYRLPEAQLDRFLFKVIIDYPSLEEEKSILHRFKGTYHSERPLEKVVPVLTATEIAACRKLVEQVYIHDGLVDYIAAVVNDTRNNGDLYLGASPRASLALLKSSKAFAAMAGRDFVIPEDIQSAAYPVLNHRVVLSPDREMEGFTTQHTIEQIIQRIEVPR